MLAYVDLVIDLLRLEKKAGDLEAARGGNCRKGRAGDFGVYV